MSEKLNILKTAFKDYLLEVYTTSRQDVDAYLDLNRNMVDRLVNDFVDQDENLSTGHQITEQRAAKLKNNLETSSLKEFSYQYEIRKGCVDFIVTNALEGGDLIFEMIALPAESRGSKKITFAMSFSNDPENYYLVLDRDTATNISTEFHTYKDNFNSEYEEIFDAGFSGNIFSGNENTKKILVSNDLYFQSLCRTVIDDVNGEAFLSLNTGLISYDLEDIFRGESRLSFFNRGQFTLYYLLEERNSLATAKYGDVFPTYPPLKES